MLQPPYNLSHVSNSHPGGVTDCLCCVAPHVLSATVMQAQRLSWHPSVALWCGNNEIDLSYEWSNSTVLRSNRNMFVVDYQAVFIDTVRKNIKQVSQAPA